MGAEFVRQGEPALAVTPSEQTFGENLDANRRAFVLGQFGRLHDRDPIAPEQIAHRRAVAGLGDKLVVLGTEHENPRFTSAYLCAAPPASSTALVRATTSPGIV